MSVTIKDVARVAGVSPQTVSNVVNQRPFVRPETRERVLKVCEELGYHPNAAARSLVTRRRNIIGLVLANIKNPIYGEIVDTITTVADRYGYAVMVGNTRRDADSEARIVRLLVEQRVDGVLLASSTWDSTATAVPQHVGIPVIQILSHPKNLTVDYYGFDNVGGTRQATSHLVGLGHTALAFVHGPLMSTSLQRQQGFREAMTAAELAVRPEWVVEGDYTLEGGYRAGRSLLERKPRPTAIVCASDMMALGVLDAAWALGMRLPEELAVVGFDDIFTASLRPVDLTTVRFDLEDLADLAIRNLLKQAQSEQRHEPLQYVTFPCHLVVRRSCGSAAPSGAPEKAKMNLSPGNSDGALRRAPSVAGGELL